MAASLVVAHAALVAVLVTRATLDVVAVSAHRRGVSTFATKVAAAVLLLRAAVADSRALLGGRRAATRRRLSLRGVTC